MSLFDTKHKKKSAVITSVILALLLYWVFNFGMKFLDPPIEYGIAINYGTSNVGEGKPKEVPKIKKSNPKPVQKEVVEKVKTTPKEVVKEKVITQDKDDAPVITKPKKKKETPKKEVKKEIPKKPKPKLKKPSKNTLKAFDNLLKGNSSDGKPKGEGNDKQPGLKGDKKGDPKSPKYYGNKGSGGDSNYNLDGRNALSKPIQKPDCQEEGIVVVSIEVDKNGRVIKAIPGVKGTTNSAECLLKPAREAALRTTWNADKNAPSKQKGTIIYKFSLSE